VGVEAERSVHPATIESRLHAIEGVAGVTRVSTIQDNEWTWHIRVRAGATEPAVRGAILRMLTDSSLRLADLSRQPPSLEDIYRRAVERARLDRADRERPKDAAGRSRGSAVPAGSAKRDSAGKRADGGVPDSATGAPRPTPAAESGARRTGGMPSRVRSRHRPERGAGSGPEAKP
jgi:hypothetical protein